jgi:hypothetical protein
MDHTAVVASLMGSEAILRFQHNRRESALCHGQSRGEPHDSAADHYGAIRF